MNPFEQSPPSPNDALIALCHHRWALPVVALCAGEPLAGAKFVTFATRLGLSRQTLTQTLTALTEQRLIARATGTHHALRPEYVLTAGGRPVAGAARVVLRELRTLNAEDVGLNKWSLPVVAALATFPKQAGRFGQLQAALPTATPRALSNALRELQSVGLASGAAGHQGLVMRELLDTYPPAAQYRISRAATRLAAATRRLAQEIAGTPGLHKSPPQPAPRLRGTG